MGSAYFVAGSYPEIAEDAFGDDLEAPDANTAAYYIDRNISGLSPPPSSENKIGGTKASRASTSRGSGGSDESLSAPFINNEHF